MPQAISITPNPAQFRWLNALMTKTWAKAFIFCGGYGVGKSFFDVLHILWLVKKYEGTPITIGVGSSTMKRLRQTMLLDLTTMLKQARIKYVYDKQEGQMTIGTTTIIIVNMELYDEIFGFNLSVMLCDEMDTLPTEKAIGAFQKCTERTRIKLPDGREPYIVISSTANGLKGVYMVYNKLKDAWNDPNIPQESKTPFIYMTGATYENPHFAKSTLELLKTLYNEKEKEAFIEGRFVNLAVGRVYPEFDPAINVHMDFPISRKDVVYIGMDFNQGYNSNVAIINKEGTLHIVKEFKCTYAGDVPRVARELFPENEIIMIPDASGKEILRGYINEMDEYGLDLRIPLKNPGISERILCANKLFRMKKLYVHQSCKEVIRGLEVRGWDENTGEPEKGRGEGAVDHYCDGLEYSLHYIINNDNIHFEALLELLKFQGNENAGKSKFLTREGLGKYINHSTNMKEVSSF